MCLVEDGPGARGQGPGWALWGGRARCQHREGGSCLSAEPGVGGVPGRSWHSDQGAGEAAGASGQREEELPERAPGLPRGNRAGVRGAL